MNKIEKIDTQLNRLRLQKSSLLHQQKQQNKSLRKARTRTLIQIGGLVSLTSLLEQCGIQLGEDLQESQNQDKADYLLGFFVKAFDELGELLNEEKESLQSLGAFTRGKTTFRP